MSREGDAAALATGVARPGRGPLIIATLLAASAVVAGGLASYLNTRGAAAAAEAVAHTHRVEAELEGLLSVLKDAETGQRGYLLTSKEAYLAPYLAAREAVSGRLDRLQALIADNPSQRDRLLGLRRLASDKLSELAETVRLRQAGQADAALAIVQSDRGRQLMEEARATVADMEAEEDRLLSERTRVARRSSLRTAASLAASTTLILGLLATLYWVAISASRRLQRSAEWLSVTLRSIGDAVIATDEIGRVKFMNPVAERLTGWPAGEAGGRALEDVFRIVNEDTREPVEHPVAVVLRERGVVGLANHTLLLARGGAEHPIFDSGAPILGLDGAVRGVVLVFKDVGEQREAERRLQASEERNRLLIEGVRDYAMYLLGPDGRVASWNAGAARISGFPAEEARGRPFSDFFAPEEVAGGAPARFLSRAASDGRHNEEVRQVRRDGSPFVASVAVTALPPEGGAPRGFAVVTHDITERMLAHKKLEDAASELGSVLDNVVDGILTIDDAGVIRSANSAAEAIFGHRREDLIGADVGLLMPEPDRSGHPRHLADYLRTGAGRVMGVGREVVGLRKDGSRFPMDIAVGEFVREGRRYFTGVVRDITERKAAETRLSRSEARLRAIVDQAAVGIEEVARDGRFLRVNPALSALLGYREDELLALRFTDVTHPGDVEADAGMARRLFAGELRAYTLQKRYVRKDGEAIWILLTSSAVGGDPGEPAYRVSIIQDITERKRAVDEVHRLNLELEERVESRTRELSEANAELEAFSYTIAHDLRAPVRNMHSLAEALDEDFGEGLPDEGRDYTGRIVAAALRMDALIQDLLSYARLSREAVRLQPVDLDEAVADVGRQMRPDLAERGAEVAVAGPLGRVVAQRTMLDQALTNLVGNAIKFVEPGRRPAVRIRSEARGGMLRLWVEDNGIGVGPEHRERIFRVFERLHGQEAYPGTGIGLAIVRKAIERMGGASGVESGPGAGSRFWIELPMGGGS
ncbi:PAS domain S-box protein [Aquisphaera giovannonii]|nr:PAS domain S-box protein [Aquisphaera giovannonii]